MRENIVGTENLKAKGHCVYLGQMITEKGHENIESI